MLDTVAKPEWLRLPPTGKYCPISGLSRSTLNELILATEENGGKPPVLSVCLRKRNKQRGVRLVNYDSLMAYIACHGGADDRGNKEEVR